jgi:hypothetical protein
MVWVRLIRFNLHWTPFDIVPYKYLKYIPDIFFFGGWGDSLGGGVDVLEFCEINYCNINSK